MPTCGEWTKIGDNKWKRYICAGVECTFTQVATFMGFDGLSHRRFKVETFDKHMEILINSETNYDSTTPPDWNRIQEWRNSLEEVSEYEYEELE